MIPYFFEDIIHPSDTSEHNYLASMCAKYYHSIRYYDGRGDFVYCYALDGLNSLRTKIDGVKHKVCIQYDNTTVSNPDIYDDIITFSPTGTYRTFPIDVNRMYSKHTLDQTVVVGNVCSNEIANRYAELINRVDGKLLIALTGRKSYIAMIKQKLDEYSHAYEMCENKSRLMIETYMKTSKSIVCATGGTCTSLHSIASYLAIHKNINYISDVDIVEPITIDCFLNNEKARWNNTN